MKNRKINKFDDVFKTFVSGDNSELHKIAIEYILSEIDLNDAYTDFLNDSNNVKNFFYMWYYAGEEETDPKEKRGLQEMGILSKKLYNEKNYRGLCEMYFNIILRHLADFIHLENRDDFKKITDHDLYIKNLIPSELFLQFFLIETMVKNMDFNWDRDEKIISQNLACLVVCFSDIYEFFHEEDKPEELDF